MEVPVADIQPNITGSEETPDIADTERQEKDHFIRILNAFKSYRLYFVHFIFGNNNNAKFTIF